MTVVDLIHSQSSFVPVRNALYQKVVVAKAAAQTPYSVTTVLVRSAGSGRRVIEPIDDSARRAPMHIASKIADVILNKSMHILRINLLRKLVNLPRRMIVAHVIDSLKHIFAADAALLETNPETIVAVH